MAFRAVSTYLNLRRLSYWIAVVEEESFTHAADRLRIAQPSLSQQVRLLERQLGVDLLERIPTGARLTAAGRAFLPEALATLAAAERALRVLDGAQSLELGRLEIATFESIAAGRLVACLHDWHHRHPGVPVETHEMQHGELEEAVRAGTGDLGIGTRPAHWSGPIEPLGWDEVLCVLPMGDPALQDSAVRLEQLRERPMVLYRRVNGFSIVVASACGMAGFEPRAAAYTASMQCAARFAAAGLGPTLVGAQSLPVELAAAAHPLSPRAFVEICAYARASWSPAATAFLEIARELPWPEKPEDGRVIPFG